MKCDEVASRIEEARLGLLSPPEARALDAHLASCAACSHAAKEAAAFEGLLDLARDPDRDAAVLRAVQNAAVARRRRGRLLLAGTTALAASLLVAAVLLRSSGGPSSLPRETIVDLAAGEVRALGEAEVRAVEPARLRSSADGRRVELLEGTARFLVESGHGRFVVATTSGDVEVLGTEFEVRIMRENAWIAAGVVVAVATGVVLFTLPDGDEVRVGSGEMAVTMPDGSVRKVSAREVASLLAEVETLRRDVAELKAEREAEVAAAGESGKTPADPPPDETVPAAVPERPEVEGVPKSVAETDWDKIGLAVAKLTEADMEGKEPTSEPLLMLQMAYLVGRLRTIGAELGLEDENEVFYHPQVAPRFMRGMARALFPEMAEADRKVLVEDLTGVIDGERSRWVTPLLPVEKQVRDLELALKMVDAVRGRLTDAEVDTLLRVVGADRPGGYSISWMAMTDVDSLRAVMGGTLSSRYELTGRDDEIARALGATFVDRHLEARARLTTELGAEAVEAALGQRRGEDGRPALTIPSASRVQVRAVLTRVQAETERSLYDRVGPEVRKKMLALPMSLWILTLSD